MLDSPNSLTPNYWSSVTFVQGQGFNERASKAQLTWEAVVLGSVKDTQI